MNLSRTTLSPPLSIFRRHNGSQKNAPKARKLLPTRVCDLTSSQRPPRIQESRTEHGRPERSAEFPVRSNVRTFHGSEKFCNPPFFTLLRTGKSALHS